MLIASNCLSRPVIKDHAYVLRIAFSLGPGIPSSGGRFGDVPILKDFYLCTDETSRVDSLVFSGSLTRLFSGSILLIDTVIVPSAKDIGAR